MDCEQSVEVQGALQLLTLSVPFFIGVKSLQKPPTLKARYFLNNFSIIDQYCIIKMDSFKLCLLETRRERASKKTVAINIVR